MHIVASYILSTQLSSLLAMVDAMILDTADDRLVDIVWDTTADTVSDAVVMVDDIMEVEDTPAVTLTNTICNE